MPTLHKVTFDRAVDIDFETFYSKEISITKLGVHQYCRQTDIYLVAIYTDTGDCYVGDPRDFDWESIEAAEVWASHNRSFDQECHNVLVERGEINGARRTALWFCTADLASYLGVKRALKEACKVLLGFEVAKDVRRLMKGLTVQEMRTCKMGATKSGKPKLVPLDHPGERCFLDDVIDYAIHDTRLGLELYLRHGHRMPMDEAKLSQLTTDQGERGIMMDVPGLKEDFKWLGAARTNILKQLPWVTDHEDDKGALSIPELKKAIEALGLKPPNTTSEDSPVCKKWEADHPGCNLVALVRDLRKVNILYRRVQTILTRIRKDGTMPFAWTYGGTHTLRWSGGSKRGTGETGFNIHNMQKAAVYIDKRTLAISDEPGASPHKIDLRKRCIARKGRKWFCADAEQIEARIVWWLAGKIDALAKVAAGMSIYEVHARDTMGWDGGKLKVENQRTYELAKKRVLSLGYQCGPGRFHDSCNAEGFPISPGEAEAVVYDYRDKEPDIKGLWRTFDNAIKVVAGRNTRRLAGKLAGELENFDVELPDGEIVRVWTPHYVRGDNRYDPGQVYGYARKGDAMRKKYYGGKVLENVAQRIGRQILARMVLTLEAFPEFAHLFSTHDEINGEIPDAWDDSQIAKIKAALEVPIPSMPGLPVSVEIKTAPYYLKG